MSIFLLKRLGVAAVTLLLASAVVFGVLEVLPGDPARLMLGMNGPAEAVEALRGQMGLDQPLLWRYLDWLGGLIRFDLGRSYTYSVPVSDLIVERLAVSLPLALSALILSTLIAVPVGVFAASRRGRAGDAVAMGMAQIGVAVPNFWLALLLVYVFAVGLRWLPAGGFPGWDTGIGSVARALTLPTLALALPQAAILARVTRTALIDTLDQDFIRTARAKGVSRHGALWNHALRNAMIPVVTIMGLQAAFLLAGTVVVENVFSLPGLGRLVFQAITQRDLIVVEGTVMLLVASVIAINLLVDLSYALIDPRQRAA